MPTWCSASSTAKTRESSVHARGSRRRTSQARLVGGEPRQGGESISPGAGGCRSAAARLADRGPAVHGRSRAHHLASPDAEDEEPRVLPRGPGRPGSRDCLGLECLERRRARLHSVMVAITTRATGRRLVVAQAGMERPESPEGCGQCRAWGDGDNLRDRYNGRPPRPGRAGCPHRHRRWESSLSRAHPTAHSPDGGYF